MSEQDTPAASLNWIEDHTKLYLEDPDKAHMWDSAPVGGPGLLPTLLLTTTGRKSGEPRQEPNPTCELCPGPIMRARYIV